jgi:hypothetical protein
MSTATINLRIQPYRLLSRSEAAHYCKRSAKKFGSQCPVQPVEMSDGDQLWDVRDLDAWIDSLKAGNGEEVDAIVSKLE